MKNQKGFSVIEGLLLAIIVCLIGGTLWYVWHSKSQANKSLSSASETSLANPSKSVKSYADCLKAPGSKILQTYPQVCVTKDGKSFTNPTQKLSSPVAPVATAVATPDNSAQVSLPQETTVDSQGDGEKDKTCGLPDGVNAPGTCVTFVFIKIKHKSGFGIKFFKSEENSENWHHRTFGQCVSSQAKTLHGYAELVCKLASGGYDYTISNGKYVVYFFGDDSDAFLKLIDSIKFAGM
jgi:hypothetical protein